MQYEDETKERIIIYSGKIANALLDRGYQIVQVRPDRRNKIKSVFLFEVTGDIENELYKLKERTQKNEQIFI